MIEDKEKWTVTLLFICIFITVGTVLPVGYSFGVVNAPEKFIRQWLNESASSRYSSKLSSSHLTIMMSSVVSVFQIGGIVGSLFSSLCNSRLGRRGSLIASGLLFLISGALQLMCRAANSLEMLLLGRTVGGIAAGVVYSTQPMYLMELAPTELSGSVGVFTCIGVTGGIVVGQIFSLDIVWGNEGYWHWALAGFVIFVVIGLGPVCLFPESPRYLMSKGKIERTRKALSCLRKNRELVEKDMANFETFPEVVDEKYSMANVICNRKFTMPLIIVCSFHFVQQMSGINAIWFYSVSIFTNAGFTLNMALWLNLVEGFLNFCIALCGLVIMNIVNRRIMMMLSCMGASIVLALLSIALSIMDMHRVVAYASIFFLSLYIITFNMGLGPISLFIGAEICETGPRSAVMAMGSLSNWTSNFLISMLFLFLHSTIGAWSFLLCASFCIYGFFLTWRYLPETRNNDPKDVASLLEHGFKSKIKSQVE